MKRNSLLSHFALSAFILAASSPIIAEARRQGNLIVLTSQDGKPWDDEDTLHAYWADTKSAFLDQDGDVFTEAQMAAQSKDQPNTIYQFNVAGQPLYMRVETQVLEDSDGDPQLDTDELSDPAENEQVFRRLMAALKADGYHEFTEI